MPIVMNVTEEEIKTQIAGNWFAWKPGQRKEIRDERITKFIEIERRGYGLAVLPSILTQAELDGDADVTPEQLKERKALRESEERPIIENALKQYTDRLRSIVKNNQISHQRDIDRSGEKYSAASDITTGELEAMRLLAKYQRKGEDETKKRMDEVEKLTKVIGK